LLGCERKDLIDGPFGAFLPPVQPDGTPSDHRLREQMTAALDGSDPTFHLQLSKRDGSAVDAEVCLKTISVTGTPVIRMRVRDVGRRKRLQRAWRRIHKQLRSAEAERQRGEETLKSLHEELETQLQERTRELERAYEEMKRLDSMKTAFLSLASHELRTPLTSIRSFSEILLHYDEDPETRKEFLEVIHTESERLTRLINDVLDMSRIEAGKLIYHDEPLEIDRIIQEVARTQKSLLEEKSLRLILEVPSDLPAVLAHPGKEITIRADCLKGKRTGDPKTWVRVSVTDQGIGIDKESLGSIFEKFYQVCSQDTLDDKPRGTGLGLPICKEIITHYNGRIWADSEKDNGSTFHFTLPAGNGSGADAP
jgi:signal transduction histidine kinase